MSFKLEWVEKIPFYKNTFLIRRLLRWSFVIFGLLTFAIYLVLFILKVGYITEKIFPELIYLYVGFLGLGILIIIYLVGICYKIQYTIDKNGIALKQLKARRPWLKNLSVWGGAILGYPGLLENGLSVDQNSFTLKWKDIRAYDFDDQAEQLILDVGNLHRIKISLKGASDLNVIQAINTYITQL